MALNNDPHLVVFSPFNEPSGAPLFKNYAPSYWNGRGSGISFDWHVHITDSDTNEPQSCWPGSASHLIELSGVTHTGYKVQGTADTNTATNQSATEKCLVLGVGGFAQKAQVLAVPNIAQSGFTIGYWVSPQSNGQIKFGIGTFEVLAKRHSLITRGATSQALYIGVSGSMTNAAQFSQDIYASGLSAFVGIPTTTGSPDIHLNTPIESGAYTHITMSYRFTSTTAAAVALYKNGRLAASGDYTGTSATLLDFGNTQWSDRPFTIGGTITSNNVGTDRYEDCTGWGHLISGVYMYDRVLDEGEILQINNQGGIQVLSTLSYPSYKTVSITDPSIITYAPFISPGFIDVSRKHHNLFSDQDEGVLTSYIICPGPFNRGMPFNDSTSANDLAIATPSGTINSILHDGNGSFSIAGWFFMDNIAGVTTTTFDNTTLFAFGPLGVGEFSSSKNPSAFCVSASGASNQVRLSARFYQDGNPSVAETQVLYAPDVDLFTSTARHVGLVYDEQTKGAALYVDGMLMQSGTLPYSLATVMNGVAGSGYPFTFLGGVINTAVDTYSNVGGDDCAVCDIFIANRPILPSEMRYIAESGIDLSPLFYSLHDPRLRAYWDCTGSGTNDHIIQDSCMIFTSGSLPAHLTQAASNTMWDNIVGSIGKTQLSSFDRISRSRDPVYGITSGSWAVMGGSDGISHASSVTGEYSRTSSADLCQRFRMCADERDLRSPYHINEYIISFNLIPSGTVPISFGSTDREVNSMLVTYGEPTASDQIISYLTSALAPSDASGIMLVFQTTDGATGTTQNPLVSGSVPYGVQSRILFHAKPLMPFNNGTDNPIETTLYINGQVAQRAQYPSHATTGPAARLYDTDTGQSATDNWGLQIGGRPTQDTVSTQATNMDGLSGIIMNSIYVMIGSFSANDILRLATSGIDTSKTITNYNNSLPTSIVTIADPNLEGYWRFSGPDSGSGITDLSSKGNDLNPLAGSIGAGTTAAFALRYVPLGFVNAAYAKQASGITYNGTVVTSTGPAPFAISGAAFQSPQNGFSIGFWMAQRGSVATNDASVLLSYGSVPTTINSSTFSDSSWAIVLDDDNTIKMILSQRGTMFLDHLNVPRTFQTVCGLNRTPLFEPAQDVEAYKKGLVGIGHIDALQHIAFSFTPSSDTNVSGIIRGYFNGDKVCEREVPTSGFHQPMVPESRFISFLLPQSDIWTFSNSRAALDAMITDVFYFSRPLGDEEVKYITFNGIAPPTSTIGSGQLGGFITGLEGADDNIGGYMVGYDAASGVLGGFMTGATASSGNIGGYLFSIDYASGVCGGYIVGTRSASGVMGGWLSAIDLASGVMGGWFRGAIRNVHYFDTAFTVSFYSTSDFDAKFRVNSTNSSDFDAKLVVYQEEQPPDIDIIVPNITLSGTSIPWNQYFVGSGRAVQGKSIVQAKWNFADFTAPVVVSESGNNLYPISHVFSQSGLYVVRFSVIDSNGQHSSATRIIDLASGVAPVSIALSGSPTIGVAPLTVQFSQDTVLLPNNVIIISQLISFDDGQESIINNPEHIYTEPGVYRPLWLVRDSRGLIWSDSLVAGVNN